MTPLDQLAQETGVNIDAAFHTSSDCTQCCGYGGWDVKEFGRYEQALAALAQEKGRE